MVVEGSTNRTIFETYHGDVLCPTLRRGQVVVMDNLSSHRGGRIRELIEQKGHELIYLPPYSPDLTPQRKSSPSSRAASEERALVANGRLWRS